MISKRTEASRVNTAQNQPHRRPPRAAAVTAAALLTLADHAHPGRQPLLPGPAEATFTVTVTNQGSGAADFVQVHGSVHHLARRAWP